jgi:hypothetical protein
LGTETRKKIGEGNMKRMRKWLLCPLIVVVLLLCAIPAYADIPTLPHAFYGTLTVDGLSAAVGTVVTAEVNEVECGSITTTVAGQYGGSGAFDEKLTVTGDIETGATISFFVNGIDTEQDYAFSPGDVTELDLTAGPPGEDTTPPSVTVSDIGTTTDTTPTFTGTATDTQSNISSVEYKVDSGSWTAADASDGAFNELSEDYTFTTAELSEGEHTVYVRATDAESNTTAEENYASDSFTIDTTAPTVDNTSPADGATDVLLDTVVTATFSERMDETTITTGSFTLDSVSGSVSYNFGTYTATFTPDANLTESTTYTATLTTAITDAAGNALAAEYSWDFTTGTELDDTPPSVTVSDLGTTGTTPTFTGTATDTQSNISSVEYKVDSGSWTAADASDGAFDELSEDYTFTTAELSEGEHTVYVRATDTASNTTAEENYATDTFTVSTEVIPGDANGDGVVNALDITKVERIIAGLDAETAGADANEDGEVNALDITMVEIIIANP